MKLIRFSDESAPRWGVEQADVVVPLDGLREEISLPELASEGYLNVLEAEVDATSGSIPRDSVRALAPVPRPGKIVCVGLNYHDHAEEQNEEVPERPLLFGKAPTAVTNPNAPIVHPTDIDQLDYEVELGVVIGRTAKNVDAGAAHEYIAGYTAMNDVSGRDAQFEDEQWFRGKSYDTFGPMGPTLVPEPYLDPNSLDVVCRVNGDTMQSSNTEQFIFNVDELVEYISHAMTLRPGDVISTGTPGGVGVFKDPPELLSDGDVVDVEIEDIGTLRNHVVAE